MKESQKIVIARLPHVSDDDTLSHLLNIFCGSGSSFEAAWSLLLVITY